jgi:hypothetical protein
MVIVPVPPVIAITVPVVIETLEVEEFVELMDILEVVLLVLELLLVGVVIVGVELLPVPDLLFPLSSRAQLKAINPEKMLKRIIIFKYIFILPPFFFKFIYKSKNDAKNN